jgi:hypothetical protein
MTTRTILFSSGEYSDYGLSGFLEIDSDAYQKAKSECEKLIEEEKAIKKKVAARSKEEGATRKELQEMARGGDALRQERRDIWWNLRETGKPVPFEEFWHGDAY